MGATLQAPTVTNQGWQHVSGSVYRHEDTDQEATLGGVILPDGIAIEEYCEWYECRLNASTRYVRVLHYAVKPAVCCTSKRQVVVLNEKMHPLEELQLSPEQLNFVFQEALIGFRQLAATFGHFLVKQGMIAVNEHGRVKVWIGHNFAQNHFTEEEDPAITEADVVNSLIRIVDAKAADRRRLETAFKEFSKVRTFDSALNFIQVLQSPQPFQMKNVFVNRMEFENYRTKAVQEGHRGSFGFGSNKTNKLEFSFGQKASLPNQNVQTSVKLEPGRKKSRIVYNQPLAQQPLPQQEINLWQNSAFRKSKISAAAHESLNQLSQQSLQSMKLPQTDIARRQTQQGLPNRNSAGTTSSYLEVPHTQHPTHQRKQSRQLQPPSVEHKPQIKMAMASQSRVDMGNHQRPQIIPHQHLPPLQPSQAKGPLPGSHLSRTESTIHTNDVSQSAHRNTLNSKISDASLSPNPRTTWQANPFNNNLLEWTLNRVSAPELRQSNHLKKSDSERLMEYRQAEMYKTIPSVDSVIIVSRSDKNEIFDPVNAPPESYQLIESTIVRDLNSYSRHK